VQRIAIVGSGVSGLTCGAVLADEYDVTLFFSERHRAASPVAAAIWYPYHIGGEAEQWALESYRQFAALARDPRAGVSMVEFHVIGEPLPGWALFVPHRQLPAGFAVEVPLIETPAYLPWLRDRLRGRMHARTIADLAELEREFDVVVNCSGLGARELCRDPLVQPGRGVVLRVPNPGIVRHVVALEGDTLTYVLSRRDDIILGGTDDSVEDDDVPDEVADAIHRRCAAVESRLPAGYVRDIGFRPLRDRVRLEREAGTRVIHNYGHGGAGFTVSWGCAREVLRMCRSIR
jgi:D-amino-acid oxidase